MTLFGLIGALVAGLGLAAALIGVEQRRLATPGAADWLAADLVADAGGVVVVQRRSLVKRVLWPLVGRLGTFVARRTPSAQLDRLHDQVLHAGLVGKLQAEDVLALNVLTSLGSVVTAVTWFTMTSPAPRMGIIGVTVIVIVGVCAPKAWLTRKVAARKESIFRDLPDALDLMVIGMEAGVTFDGALQVVTSHLDGPLGEELMRTLAEMELGLSRRDALLNLKRRVDVPEVSNVVVALLQADALGMSVGRVLRVQAVEMRAKRRQWAREKAGKLPVKILFPLIAFIFPPVLIIIVGPIAGDIAGLFG